MRRDASVVVHLNPLLSLLSQFIPLESVTIVICGVKNLDLPISSYIIFLRSCGYSCCSFNVVDSLAEVKILLGLMDMLALNSGCVRIASWGRRVWTKFGSIRCLSIN